MYLHILPLISHSNTLSSFATSHIHKNPFLTPCQTPHEIRLPPPLHPHTHTSFSSLASIPPLSPQDLAPITNTIHLLKTPCHSSNHYYSASLSYVQYTGKLKKEYYCIIRMYSAISLFDILD